MVLSAPMIFARTCCMRAFCLVAEHVHNMLVLSLHFICTPCPAYEPTYNKIFDKAACASARGRAFIRALAPYAGISGFLNVHRLPDASVCVRVRIRVCSPTDTIWSIGEVTDTEYLKTSLSNDVHEYPRARARLSTILLTRQVWTSVEQLLQRVMSVRR